MPDKSEDKHGYSSPAHPKNVALVGHSIEFGLNPGASLDQIIDFSFDDAHAAFQVAQTMAGNVTVPPASMGLVERWIFGIFTMEISAGRSH